MAGYNKTIIIGRLGQDPEFKKRNGMDYTKFPICNSVFKDGQEEVQWHNIACFGKQAILCHDHLSKGDLCCVEGRLDSQSYLKDGVEQKKVTIIAERITFLSSKHKQKEASNESQQD